jgi:flagellar hook protein FlgE
MYAAIAGLKAHMNKLNVISNNISNINTNGYKTQRTVFRDSLYTTYSSGSDGTGTVGSKNPSQIGYGSTVASIDLDMTPGTYAPGNALDCTLYGDGFFLVGDKDVANVITATDPTSFKSLTLARVGDFRFGADGYLTDGNGMTVYGFMNTGTDSEGNPIICDQLVPIRLPMMEKMYVSTTVDQADNKTTTKYLTETDYKAMTDGPDKDAYVATYVVRYATTKTTNDTEETDATEDVDVRLTADTVGALHDYPGQLLSKDTNEREELEFAQVDSISIDESGRITATLKDTDQWITIGYLAVGNVTNPNGVSHIGDSYYKADSGAGDLTISMLNGVNEDLGLEYVNGSLAGNAERLSTKAQISSAGTTNLITGGLEGSNVDLATEISEMITTQRGYQANTRIITVTDTMLEELVNMKR